MPLDVATHKLGRLSAIVRSPFRMGTLAIYQREGGALGIPPHAPRRAPRVRVSPAPALPLPVRRFLSITEAAEYVGVSVATFREEVADRQWPQPVRRGKSGRALTWDVRALDKSADLVAGIVPSVAPVAPDATAAMRVAEAAALARFK